MAGGSPPKLPLGLDQWIYAIPYGAVSYLAASLTPWMPLWGIIGLTLLGYATAFLGKRTGHGQYLDLGTWTRKITPEKLDFLVELVFGKDKNALEDNVKGNPNRDRFGLFVTGAVVASGCSIALMLSPGGIIPGLLVLLGGGAKAAAYTFGWSLDEKLKGTLGDKLRPHHLHEPTGIGEYLTGFLGGLPLFFIGLTLLFSP
jgi:hypothetical protein